jgi:Ca-activated chloride channel homolog
MLYKATLFLGILFSSMACAQTRPQSRTLTGTVRDAQTFSPLPGVNLQIKGSQTATTTDSQGRYRLVISDSTHKTVVVSYIGYVRKEITPKPQATAIDVSLHSDNKQLSEVVVTGYGIQQRKALTGAVANVQKSRNRSMAAPMVLYDSEIARPAPREANTEDYSPIREDGFREVRRQPVTTFSADVDRAAYTNVRRFLNMGQLPPKDAVRVEEMINYFRYELPQPTGKDPVSITTELTESPFNPGFQLLRIGLQARTIPTDNLPPTNLTFLIDVSGSMNQENKLPLVKMALNELVNQLRPSDRVAIVVYAGAAGLVLPPTPGNQTERIRDAINGLEAGGSTAGGAGIQLAYKTAREHLIKGGNNRVILASDGDFNVGISLNGELERLIEKERESGVFLSVLGFGMGNYKDSKLESLADKGNGNYAYIDNAQEARKVFGQEFGGTLFTVAKDVKLQLEFNPRFVQGYRLIGYENRQLNNEDFNDDKKDAGDLGSGHSVTALYELIPAGVSSSFLKPTDELKYQKTADLIPTPNNSDERLTLKVRYKNPDDSTSQLLTHVHKAAPVPLTKTSDDCRFATAVAGFGLVLRESDYRGKATYRDMATLARNAFGPDADGYRRELVRLVEVAGGLK